VGERPQLPVRADVFNCRDKETIHVAIKIAA
jgi:hypothetical protein